MEAAEQDLDLLQLLERAAGSPSASFATWPDPMPPVPAGTVLDRALACGGGLRQAGVSAGDTVLLALGNSIDFVVAFFGIIAAGAIPVPLPWPGERGRHLSRFRHAAEDSRAPVAIVPSAAAAGDILGGATRPRVVTPADLADGPSYRRRGGQAGPAFVQYTSGSTGQPKPVAPTQQNVLAQLSLAAAAYDEDAGSCSVTWVPCFHDMGLVTGVLRPTFSRYRTVLMEPEAFVRSPQQWLVALSVFGATHTCAPNFGYDLCTRKASPDGLDLRRLRVARNAGEPVVPATISRFTEKFAAAGFRGQAMCPSYGLAEAVLTVTTSGPGREPRFIEVTRSGLERGRAEAAVGTGTGVTVVSSGFPLPGTEVRVLGPDGEALPPGSIGEIVIAGPQVVRAPEAETAAGFRRTGDVGFLWSGELVVVARHVEKLSIRGRTMYAAEIERFVADAFSETRPGRIGVVPLPANGTEQFAILAESAGDLPDERRLAREIRMAVTREYGTNPAVVRICARGSLPVTSSGKLDRAALRGAAPGPADREATR